MKGAGEPSSVMTRSPKARLPMVCPFQSHSSRMKYAHTRLSVRSSAAPVASTIAPPITGIASTITRMAVATMTVAIRKSSSAAKPRLPAPARSYRNTT